MSRAVFPLAKTTSANIGVGIGGSGGSGGDSSCGSDPCWVVDSTFDGAISTVGDNSDGFFSSVCGRRRRRGCAERTRWCGVIA